MIKTLLVYVVGTFAVFMGCTTTGNMPAEEKVKSPLIPSPTSIGPSTLNLTGSTSPEESPTPEIKLNPVAPATTATLTPFEASFGISFEEALARYAEHERDSARKWQEFLISMKDYQEPTSIPIVSNEPSFTLIPHRLPIDEGRTIVEGYGNSQYWAYYLELFTCNRSKNYSYGIRRSVDRKTNLTLFRLSDSNRKSYCDTCVRCTTCSPTFLEGSEFYTIEALVERFVTELEEKYPRRCRYER